MVAPESQQGGVSGYVESLRRERDRFVALAFCAADILIEINSEQKISFAAGATQSLVGAEPEALMGTDFANLIHPEKQLLVQELLANMSPGTRLDPVQVELAGPSGSVQLVSMTGYHLPDMPGHHYFAFRLIPENSTVEISASAERDSDTGLLKKEAFAEIASRQIHEAQSRGEQLKLTMIHTGDLDEFRDRLDHESSETLMRSMGACLQASSAAGQTAGQLDEGAFGLLHDDAFDVAGITSRVEEIFRTADPSGDGIAVKSGTIDADIGELTEADSVRVMLYTVNRFCDRQGVDFDMTSLSGNLEKLTRENTETLSRFREITDQGKFDVAFQPIVSLADGSVHHYEALARFNKKIENSPYQLITFAENTGIIADFDLAMCARVLGWLQAMNAQGYEYSVAINVSGQSLANTAFIAALHDQLERASTVRQQILFEITESANIEDLSAANRFIQGLRSFGHKVCLDDFGAGAAALRYLHALEVDIVKIDGQYVRSAARNDRNRAFLKAVTGLCHDLGIATVAEMVEDEECADMLRACDVRFGQGYLFGKPSFSIPDVGTSPDASVVSVEELRRRNPIAQRKNQEG
jgi:EAL domain-containing protein (putative c-di-GMP-specific phosphodiesterase class I)/GGDEF domain-containing protein